MAIRRLGCHTSHARTIGVLLAFARAIRYNARKCLIMEFVTLGNESPHHHQPAIYTPTPPPLSRPLGNRPLSRPIAPTPQPPSRPITSGATRQRHKPRWGRRIAIVGICLLIALVALGMVVESSILMRFWSSSNVTENNVALAHQHHATLR